ncbi:MarR family winged helix-turn-helix transcriptional regulator [Emcibacter nanhaiensis]|uniref:MarR family winged helix-turn-helix transcriptional regulator n=1 Tax=Emcibacter nanhaiensis TaxID=1505037 RepID=UPI001C614989|nr:MarR family transcriptional regulator [Emcibacter nanhaiensis]
MRLFTDTALIEKQTRRLLRTHFGVTLPQFDLMAALDRAPGGMTMGELSKQLLVSNGNVTGVVERLQQEGLVKRWPLPTDRRIYSVGLTAKGRSTFREMAESHEGWVNEILSDMDEAAVDEMTRHLDFLRDSLKKKADEETSGSRK